MNAAKNEKKMKRKLASEKALQVQKTIKSAKEVTDVMSLFPSFRNFERNDVSAELMSSAGGDLSAETLQWAFHLCKKHMQKLYEDAWGWSDRKKLRELQHPDAQFLIVTQQESIKTSGQQEHLAYIHFRYEEEAGEAVLYVYELQVEEHSQRKGIARLLMRLMELVAWKLGFHSVILTVMQANLSAIALYNSLGYTKHATCPPPPQDGSAGYLIFSKEVPTKKQ